MIVSIHIRKAAGTSFRKALREFYGDRLYIDYGDEIGSNTFKSRLKRLKKRIKLITKNKEFRNKDIIHGHFFGRKYESMFDSIQYATFLRDPVQRVLSNYYYLKRNPNRKNDDAKMFRLRDITLEEYILYKDSQNLQAQFLNGLNLDVFDFVGIVEDYSRSISLFNRVFNTDLKNNYFENSNPQSIKKYTPSNEIVDLIQKVNSEDIRLYNQGLEIFKSSCQKNNL